MVTAQPPAEPPVPLRDSLRLRLPLLIALLIVGGLSAFLWLAFREVEASLVRAGGVRAQGAADQLAGLFERSAAQSAEQLRLLAADEAIHRYLQDPNDQTSEAVRRRFEALRTAAPRKVELWAEDGTRLLGVSLPGTASAPAAKELPPTAPPSETGVSQLHSSEGVVFSDAVADIPRPPPEPGSAARGGRVLIRSTVSVNPPGIIGQLVGADAHVLLGNKVGGTWTDLSRVVPAPPVDLAGRGVREYRSQSGHSRLGAVSDVRQTPLAVWVEFPRDLIVAPAREFLRNMIVLAGGFVLIASALVGTLTRRITTPLHTVALAATQIAGGDYSRRVAIKRPDEIGELGGAFNRMAGEIQTVYRSLKDNHDQTQFALGAAHMAIGQFDVRTDRITWSHSLASVLGVDRDAGPATSHAFVNLIHPEDRASVDATVRQAIAERPDELSTTFRVSWPDRSLHWLDLRARLFYDQDGRPTGVLGVAIDVTRRVTLEDQLRQAQKLEGIGQLAGGVAHDFNNLLTAILGFADVVKDGLAPDDPLRGHVTEIYAAGSRGAALTRQLLAFSRQQVLEPTTLNLNELVTATSGMLRRLIGEHIELVTKLSADLEPVLADRSQLEQVIINLAVNARDAMPKGGTLSIESANVELDDAYVVNHVVVRPGRYVMLAVSDTGVGMSQETMRRLFEPFFTTKERGRGTGLGLATVYGIVKQSGGYIWAYSEQGHGAVFKIYLPRAEQAAEPERPPAPVQVRATGSELVMVVEDDDGVRHLARRILENAGYTVLEASNPELAETIFTNDVRLLISDVIMPGASGPELFQKLAARQPALKVLFTSGYTDDMIAHHGRLEPDTAFLQKPFTPETLRRKVRELLDAYPRQTL